ncbi:MAG: GNAT family N-acetyltransferase [Petrotogaceae bacterium]|nr:GNAT family N-acetyltransferase [Petrotogaceae bacterium]
MVEQNVIIRLATAKDKKTLSKIKNNAFPFLMRFFFSSSKDTLVAEKNGEVVGGAVLKIFNLKNKKCGHVLELFVSKEEQKNGVGKKLAQASLTYMKDMGCEEIFACVEGNNTGSSNIFSKNGFSVLSLYDQIKNYGFSYFKLLYNTFHIFDIGHFLWKFPANQKHFDSSAVQFLMSILLNIIVFLIACLRINNSIWTAPGELLYVSAAFSILFIVRFIFMITASKVQRIPVRFRLWESGITLNILIAGIFGGFFPVPGSIYPKQTEWRYPDLKKKLGIVGLSGIISTALVLSIFTLIQKFGNTDHPLNTFVAYNILIGKNLLFFNVLIPIFPLGCYDSRRVFDNSKLLWAVLALICAFLIFLI